MKWYAKKLFHENEEIREMENEKVGGGEAETAEEEVTTALNGNERRGI